MEWLQLALLVLGGYLLGAVPFGWWIGLRLGRDLREHGSGKTGATNALRVLGWRPALLVFLCDAAKGALPVYIAHALPWPDSTWQAIAMGAAGTAAIIGHDWSLWIRLATGKWGGGRGVSTGLGITLAVHPVAAIAGLGVAIAVIFISRYVSLGSILGTTVGVLTVVLFVLLGSISPWFIPWALLIGALIIILHHDNIRRLLSGTERKIGQSV